MIPSHELEAFEQRPTVPKSDLNALQKPVEMVLVEKAPERYLTPRAARYLARKAKKESE